VDPNTVDAFWRFGNSGLRPPSGRIPGYWDAEELTSFAWDMRLTLSCLQGIANRRRPRLYLLHDRYDELWLDWLRERGDVDAIEWLEVGQVFERFLPDAVPLYVTDPAVPASVNVATMLASVYDGLVATPNTLGLFKLPLGTNTSTLPAGLDLRILGWKKDVHAYRWAFEHLESSLSRQAVCILDPHEVALRDYLVEFKIPVLWISGPQEVRNNPKSWSEQEVQFAREILMKWPPNIPCFGWRRRLRADASQRTSRPAFGSRRKHQNRNQLWRGRIHCPPGRGCLASNHLRLGCQRRVCTRSHRKSGWRSGSHAARRRQISGFACR